MFLQLRRSSRSRMFLKGVQPTKAGGRNAKEKGRAELISTTKRPSSAICCVRSAHLSLPVFLHLEDPNTTISSESRGRTLTTRSYVLLGTFREKQLEFLLAITNHFSHSALILGPKYNQAQTKFVLDILEYSYLVLLWSTIFIFNHEYL